MQPLSPEARERMRAHPAAQPPPGVEPNFVDPWSMESSGVGALHGLYALSTLMVILKLSTQLGIVRKMLLEDYFLILAWLLWTAAYEPVGDMLVHSKMGVHQWNITFGDQSDYLFYQYVLFAFWGIISLLLKVTILLQYLRIFVAPGIRNYTFWASHILLYANVAYYVAFTFLQIFACNPRARFWDWTIVEGECIDIFAINVSGAVVCLVSDLAILHIPQRALMKLNMPRSKVWGLSALFAIGIFACVTSAVRVYYNVRIWQDQYDLTGQLGYLSFWGTAQFPAGFLVICLPSLPRVIAWLRTKEWFTRLESSMWSALSRSMTGVRTITQIVTIGGGPRRQQRTTVVTDAEFQDLMATDGKSVHSHNQMTQISTNEARPSDAGMPQIITNEGRPSDAGAAV
jgi:hypothetical protein